MTGAVGGDGELTGAVVDSGEYGDSVVWPLMPGTVELAGPGSRLGAPGSKTGSRGGLALCRIEWHPATKMSAAVATARRVDLFINRLLRECVIGERSLIHADIIILG